MQRAMWGGRGETRRRSKPSSPAKSSPRTRRPITTALRCGRKPSTNVPENPPPRRMGPGSRFAWPGRQLQRYLPILPIAETGFFQVEVAFDTPPCFVGDLAVPQQGVDEVPLRCNQFPCQLGAGRRYVVRVGIKRIGQLVGADVVPCVQQLDDFVRELAVVGDGIERLERGIKRLAPRRDLCFDARRYVRCGRPWQRRASAPPAAIQTPIRSV